MTGEMVTKKEDQYLLGKILLIWLLATLPMAFLGWIVGPILTNFLNLPDTVDFGVALFTSNLSNF